MRQQDKVIIWPVYFDSSKTRKNGRRVSKALSVSTPRASEVKEAAVKLHLTCEFVPDNGYAKMPWTKPGMILIKKGMDSKEAIMRRIAAEMQKTRNTNVTKP